MLYSKFQTNPDCRIRLCLRRSGGVGRREKGKKKTQLLCTSLTNSEGTRTRVPWSYIQGKKEITDTWEGHMTTEVQVAATELQTKDFTNKNARKR